MSGTENNAPAPKRSKRRWFAWLLLGVLGGTALYLFEPRIYRAHTNVLIIPQRVPERMIPSTVTLAIGERLNMILQQVLSRTQLERIIQEFNLYQAERRELIMEDVIERMRYDISVNVSRSRDGEDVQSFSVAFTSTDPRTAMRVTERLGSLFIQENLEDRLLLADQTDQFLQSQLKSMREELLRTEMKMAGAKKSGTATSSLQADYEVLLETYKQVAAHQHTAQLAVSLERQQIGEQFRIIDGARLPEKPISPRLFPYLALGALAGLAAGILFSIASWAWRRRRPPVATAA